MALFPASAFIPMASGCVLKELNSAGVKKALQLFLLG